MNELNSSRQLSRRRTSRINKIYFISSIYFKYDLFRLAEILPFLLYHHYQPDIPYISIRFCIPVNNIVKTNLKYPSSEFIRQSDNHKIFWETGSGDWRVHKKNILREKGIKSIYEKKRSRIRCSKRDRWLTGKQEAVRWRALVKEEKETRGIEDWEGERQRKSNGSEPVSRAARLRKSEILARPASNLRLAGDNFLSLRASQAQPVVPIA